MIAHRKTVRCGIVVATLVAFVAFGITTINTVAKYVGVEDDTVTLSVRKPRYVVKFNANGGTGTMDDQDFTYGTWQHLSTNAFERDGYDFRGWSRTTDGADGSFYRDEQSVVNLSSEDGAEITLYAQWERFAYYNAGPVTFGVDENNKPKNCIDTEVKLYSEENIDKNYEIAFDINSVDGYDYLDSLMNAMDESGSPYPGLVFRMNARNKYVLMATGASSNPSYNVSGGVDKVVIKRFRGALTISFNGMEYLVAENAPAARHNAPVAFGCSMDGNGNFMRPFLGTLSNMSVRVEEDKTYVISYDANGGFGSVESQVVDSDFSINLSKNQFLRREYVFANWNTEADGSGDSYTDEQMVRNLAEVGDEAVLYAIWRDAGKYTVKFNANGGTGEMDDQLIFADNMPYALDASGFTKDGYAFAKWNTMPDGSGDSYLNGQEVTALAAEGEEITLYAIWAEQAYTHIADRTFAGTTDDFDDTGIELFSEDNAGKDFEISFDIREALSTDKQATIVSAMDEGGSPWPGMVFRVQNDKLFEISANANNSTKIETRYSREGIESVLIKRVGGVLYLCFNKGECEQVISYANLIRTFNSPTVFGASMKPNGTTQRPFKGTLYNMSVILYPSNEEANSGD